jgi:hypothetical protein
MQKKVRLQIDNNSHLSIDIGGGTSSSLRLLVAFAYENPVTLTLPVASSKDDTVWAQVPRERDLRQASSWETFEPTLLEDATDVLGLPEHYDVYLLPPTPHAVVELLESGDNTFPTYVSKTVLKPGESINEEVNIEVGVDTWTFYVPYPPGSEFWASSPFLPFFEKGEWDSDFVLVGIAALASTSGTAELLGFVPFPSTSHWVSPMSF